jgi:signal transduction histidine kinase
MILLKTKAILLILLFFVFSPPLIAQEIKEDSIQVENLLKRSLKVVYSQPDSAFFYCNQALKKGKEDSYLKGKSLNHLGIYYDVTSNNDSAIICYEKAIELALKAHSEINEASALNNLGLIYWNQAKYDEAIVYFNRSIILFEKLDMKTGIASTLNNIGLIYNETKNYKKAVEYFHQSKINYQNIESKYGVSAAFTNLAIAHYQLGNYDSSFYYNHASIPIKKEIKDNWGLATNYLNISTDFEYFNQIDSSYYYTTKAEKLYRSLNSKSNLATVLSGKGMLLVKLKQFSESYATLKEAEKLALETQSKKTLKNIYDHYSDLYYEQKNYLKAYDYLDKRYEIEKEIYNAEKDRAVTEIQTKYETIKKDNEIALNKEEILKKELLVQSKNNQLLIALSAVVLLIALIYFIFQFQLNKRKKLKLKFEAQEKINEANFNKELAEDKLRISRDLHDNIGAHLTFIIASIDNLSFTEKENYRKEKLNTISNFGKQTMKELRGTIWAIKNDGASLNELLFRIADLKINIDIPIHIENEIKVNHELSSNQLLNLYRIIQEAIQNTTKHANASKLTVLFYSSEKEIIITIKDNGKGFIMKESYSSNGLKNMAERSKSINANFKIESSTSGTEIRCKMPL